VSIHTALACSPSLLQPPKCALEFTPRGFFAPRPTLFYRSTRQRLLPLIRPSPGNAIPSLSYPPFSLFLASLIPQQPIIYFYSLYFVQFPGVSYLCVFPPVLSVYVIYRFFPTRNFFLSLFTGFFQASMGPSFFEFSLPSLTECLMPFFLSRGRRMSKFYRDRLPWVYSGALPVFSIKVPAISALCVGSRAYFSFYSVFFSTISFRRILKIYLILASSWPPLTFIVKVSTPP